MTKPPKLPRSKDLTTAQWLLTAGMIVGVYLLVAGTVLYVSIRIIKCAWQ